MKKKKFLFILCLSLIIIGASAINPHNSTPNGYDLEDINSL